MSINTNSINANLGKINLNSFWISTHRSQGLASISTNAVSISKNILSISLNKSQISVSSVAISTLNAKQLEQDYFYVNPSNISITANVAKQLISPWTIKSGKTMEFSANVVV